MKVWVLIEIELLNERESSDYSVVGVFSSRGGIITTYTGVRIIYLLCYG